MKSLLLAGVLAVGFGSAAFAGPETRGNGERFNLNATTKHPATGAVSSWLAGQYEEITVCRNAADDIRAAHGRLGLNFAAMCSPTRAY